MQIAVIVYKNIFFKLQTKNTIKQNSTTYTWDISVWTLVTIRVDLTLVSITIC